MCGIALNQVPGWTSASRSLQFTRHQYYHKTRSQGARLAPTGIDWGQWHSSKSRTEYQPLEWGGCDLSPELSSVTFPKHKCKFGDIFPQGRFFPLGTFVFILYMHVAFSHHHQRRIDFNTVNCSILQGWIMRASLPAGWDWPILSLGARFPNTLPGEEWTPILARWTHSW